MSSWLIGSLVLELLCAVLFLFLLVLSFGILHVDRSKSASASGASHSQSVQSPVDTPAAEVAEVAESELPIERKSAEPALAAKTVQYIDFEAGSFVDSMNFHYTDGSEALVGEKRGELPSSQPRLKMAIDEHIVGITCRQDAAHLLGMQFVTSYNRTTEWFGEQAGGEQFHIKASPGKHIVCISRANGLGGKISGIVEAPILNPVNTILVQKAADVKLSKVEVQTSPFVQLMRFVYSDGSSTQIGEDTGSPTEPFLLEEDEWIVEVSGRQRLGLDACQFLTNKGRSSLLYGNPVGGDAFVFKAAADRQLWSLQRAGGMERSGPIAGISIADTPREPEPAPSPEPVPVQDEGKVLHVRWLTLLLPLMYIAGFVTILSIMWNIFGLISASGFGLGCSEVPVDIIVLASCSVAKAVLAQTCSLFDMIHHWSWWQTEKTVALVVVEPESRSPQEVAPEDDDSLFAEI